MWHFGDKFHASYIISKKTSLKKQKRQSNTVNLTRDRQWKDKEKKDNMRNNDIQNITQKIKDRTQKSGMNSGTLGG